MPEQPTIEGIHAAAARLKGLAVETPLLESELLNERLGGRILVKAEMLQRTGSFKFRGAYNRIATLDVASRKSGVVAYSSGNHAQGVAAAAKLLGIPAVIVMPEDAPEIKISSTRALGAEVILYDRLRENREALGEKVAGDRGLTLIRPYDDPFIIEGQGTAGLEIVRQARAMDARQAKSMDAGLDALLAPCGGGGLIAGVSLALTEESPATEIYSVEPIGFDDMARSLQAGERVGNSGDAASFCDALKAQMPGEMTFAVNSRLLKGGLAVSDGAVAAAMRLLFESLKIVAEPGGAVGLAALIEGAFPLRGKTVCVVCSGGNVDPGTFREVLAG